MTVLMWSRYYPGRLTALLCTWAALAYVALVSLRMLYMILCDSSYSTNRKTIYNVSNGLFILLTCFLVVWTFLGSVWYQEFLSSKEGKVRIIQTLSLRTQWALPSCFVICDVATMICAAYIANKATQYLLNDSSGGDRDRTGSMIDTLEVQLTAVSVEWLQSLVSEYKGEKDEFCAICCDVLKDKTVRLPKCEHTFHACCILEWVRRKAICPYCRRAIEVLEPIE